jgi:hypothetical protein
MRFCYFPSVSYDAAFPTGFVLLSLGIQYTHNYRHNIRTEHINVYHDVRNRIWIVPLCNEFTGIPLEILRNRPAEVYFYIELYRYRNILRRSRDGDYTSLSLKSIWVPWNNRSPPLAPKPTQAKKMIPVDGIVQISASFHQLFILAMSGTCRILQRSSTLKSNGNKQRGGHRDIGIPWEWGHIGAEFHTFQLMPRNNLSFRSIFDFITYLSSFAKIISNYMIIPSFWQCILRGSEWRN